MTKTFAVVTRAVRPMNEFKAGAIVEIEGFALDNTVVWERGRIKRWNDKVNGDRSGVPGYHVVRFDRDGAILLVHEEGLRIVKAEGRS